MRLVFNNRELEALHVSGPYTHERLEAIAQVLEAHHTLRVKPLPTGLYPASGALTTVSGYGNVWVRDNVYVAFAQWQNGRPDVAADVAKGLLAFYGKYRHRLTAPASDDVMERPHVRFDGTRLEEISSERWSHAQNDALGYCLWLCSRLLRRDVLTVDRAAFETLALLPQYFAARQFWQDEDSGHWEETRKVSASSIGVVVAGLREWVQLLAERPELLPPNMSRARTMTTAEASCELGTRALAAILPNECVQVSPRQHRAFDAALLFLLYPLNVVGGALGDLVLSQVRRYLQGRVGIRRYLGDSYFAPDYDLLLSESERTRDFSNDLELRDVLLETVGEEAEWCVFDPIVSALYGRRFRESGARADLEAQAWHFNRSIAHITPDWLCPELYYRRDGRFVPNPHTPLLWTQSNLQLALSAMRATAGSIATAGV